MNEMHTSQRLAMRRGWAVAHFGLYGSGVMWASRMQLTQDAVWWLGGISVCFGAGALIVCWQALGSHGQKLGLVSLGLAPLAAVMPTPAPLEVQTFRDLYEAAVLFDVVITVGLVGWSAPRDIKIFLLPCLAYGLALENGGILMGYFSEGGYRIPLWPLPGPLATTAGWLVVITVAVDTTRMLGDRLPFFTTGAGGAAGVAACGLALDLGFDPIATEMELWVWHAVLPAQWFGVPWLNYVAWLTALLPLGFAIFFYGRENRADLWRRIPAVGVAASVLFSVGMVLVDGGTSGPTAHVIAERLASWGVGAPP